MPRELKPGLFQLSRFNQPIWGNNDKFDIHWAGSQGRQENFWELVTVRVSRSVFSTAGRTVRA